MPALFAHGYQTLADETEVVYMVSEFYTPEHERGRGMTTRRSGSSGPCP